MPPGSTASERLGDCQPPPAESAGCGPPGPQVGAPRVRGPRWGRPGCGVRGGGAGVRGPRWGREGPLSCEDAGRRPPPGPSSGCGAGRPRGPLSVARARSFSARGSHSARAPGRAAGKVPRKRAEPPDPHPRGSETRERSGLSHGPRAAAGRRVPSAPAPPPAPAPRPPRLPRRLRARPASGARSAPARAREALPRAPPCGRGGRARKTRQVFLPAARSPAPTLKNAGILHDL